MRKLLFLAGILFLQFTIPACNSGEQSQPKEKAEETNSKKAPQQDEKIKAKLDSLNGILDRNPNNLEALLARGNTYLDALNPAYARADADAAYFLDSTSEDVLLLRGDVNYVLNRTRLSRDMWERCSQLFPKNTECRLRAAELYLAVQDLEKALEKVNEVLNVDAQNPKAIFMKGVIVRDKYADTTLALQYFQRAIDLKDGDYIEAIDMMGTLLANKRDPMAIQYFKNALEIDPNRYDLYAKMGLVYTYEEDYNAALEYYEKSLQLKPRNDEVYFNIGFIHITLKNYDLAIDNFNKSLEIREMNVKALYGRGFAYEMRGDVMNAARDYQSCLGMFPDYNPAKEGIARLKRITKDDDIDLDNL
ncbi:MAG: tetratricopeptide repeat protein [Cryomorphaceae bacterium]|nr:tetratricopeptide repeat protein [Cryomorphaceae bacterium]